LRKWKYNGARAELEARNDRDAKPWGGKEIAKSVRFEPDTLLS
jgi:hypothetical protein